MSILAIQKVSKFYNREATKDRAKELVNELSSDERAMLLSVIKNTPEADANALAKLTTKLLSIKGNAPIAHIKDAALSSVAKTMMNIWRDIKDLFGTRISDKKLIKEIKAYSNAYGILARGKARTMQVINSPIAKDIDDELISKSPKELFLLAEATADYTLDLSKTLYQDLTGPILEQNFVQAFIHAGTEDEEKRIHFDFLDLLVAEMIKNEFFQSNLPFSISNLKLEVDKRGYDNLSTPQLNQVHLFLIVYLESQGKE